MTDTLCAWSLQEGRARPTTDANATLWVVDTPTALPAVWPCLALVPTDTLAKTRLPSMVPREAPWPVIHAALCATAMGLEVRAPLTPDLHLTPREQQVLDLLALGYSNPEIAKHLRFSRHTAKFHVTAVLDKLDATTRTEAAVRACSLGLLHPPHMGRMSTLPGWTASGNPTGVDMSPTEGFLGIGIEPQIDGVRITDIEPGSPAEALRIEDTIRTIDGLPITSMASLRSALSVGPRARIEVVFERNGKRTSEHIVLAERPEGL